MARALGTQLLNYSRTKLEAISMEYGYDLKPSAACHRRRALILYALFLRQRNTRRNRLSIERIGKLQDVEPRANTGPGNRSEKTIAPVIVRMFEFDCGRWPICKH